MTVRNFCQLCEMLDCAKVKLQMSLATHKYILGVSGSIDPKAIEDKLVRDHLEDIRVEHDNTNYRTVRFTPTFKPRIGDGFEVKLE